MTKALTQLIERLITLIGIKEVTLDGLAFDSGKEALRDSGGVEIGNVREVGRGEEFFSAFEKVSEVVDVGNRLRKLRGNRICITGFNVFPIYILELDRQVPRDLAPCFLSPLAPCA